jgi:hypothetical protein
MPDGAACTLPVWAHRLRKSEIERLYRSCASGLLDAELIDEVGFGLYARCLSMLEVHEAMQGRPLCPQCRATATIQELWTPQATAVCAACGWRCSWKAYQKTYQRKGLFAGGMESFIREFVHRFASVHEPGERLVLIDTLIHRFHWESGDKATGRPGATSLIEGTMTDIVAFLDRLTYGDAAPAGIAKKREEWRRKWKENPWSYGRGQKPKNGLRTTSPRAEVEG